MIGRGTPRNISRIDRTSGPPVHGMSFGETAEAEPVTWRGEGCSPRGRVPPGGGEGRVAALGEGLADHFFALGPERLGAGRVEGVAADAAARIETLALRGRFGQVAVLAVEAADQVGRRYDARPAGGRRALRDGLPLESGPTAGLGRGGDVVDHRLDHPRVHMPAELGLDAARMDGGRAHATALVAAVEFHGEQDVRGLRAAV